MQFEAERRPLRYLERVTNAAVIFAVIVFCVTVAKDYWLKQTAHSGQGAIHQANNFKGTKLLVSGVDWSQSDRTLVLAISTQCHFCLESIPLYRTLSGAAAVKTGKVSIVAIMPQEMSAAQSFVKQSDIHANKVISVDLDRIGVSGTPTIFIVNRTGTIESAWIGKLSAAEQRELAAKLES
jgi:hypothetical protein